MVVEYYQGDTYIGRRIKLYTIELFSLLERSIFAYTFLVFFLFYIFNIVCQTFNDQT